MDVLRTLGRRRTPQSEAADTRQRRNAAGGYAFVLDDAARLRRILMLGVDGGTYYAAPRDLARDNAEVVTRMAQEDPAALVSTIVEVSQAGAAPKQNPALFALALAVSYPESSGWRWTRCRRSLGRARTCSCSPPMSSSSAAGAAVCAAPWAPGTPPATPTPWPTRS